MSRKDAHALAPASAIPLTAQATPAPAVTPAARPADVATEDAIMAALYDVISGPAGQQRDWDRMRSLFQAGARLIPTFKAQDGSWQLRTWSKRASSSAKWRGAPSASATWCMPGAPTRAASGPRIRHRSSGASTASRCATMARGGGS